MTLLRGSCCNRVARWLQCPKRIQQHTIVWRSHIAGTSSPLLGFETYGWKPDDSLSNDENLMDLTMLITRGSKLRDGSMACLFVKDESNSEESHLIDRIVSVATNMPLWNNNTSDIHAEIVAMGKAARQGIALNKCTAFITMPPCKNCFGALYSAGIRRIVTPKQLMKEHLRTAADTHGIVLKVVASDRKRVDEIVKAHTIRCNE